MFQLLASTFLNKIYTVEPCYKEFGYNKTLL